MAFYNPYSYQNYLPYQQTVQQPIQQPVQQQSAIHYGGIVSVRTEQEARNYPVAPSTSMTFHNENEPYIYTKTVGSSLEPPKFEKFKLVKEEISDKTVETTKDMKYVEKDEFEALKADFNALRKELSCKSEQSNAINADVEPV